MNFTELSEAVLAIVKRPDKAAQVGNAINTALARTLFKTEFTHDLVEATIPLDDTLYTQTINLPSLAALDVFVANGGELVTVSDIENATYDRPGDIYLRWDGEWISRSTGKIAF